jgi:hypothetical protein
VFQALASIGSLLGLMKIFVIFTLLNQWRFEKGLQKKYGSLVKKEGFNEDEKNDETVLLDASPKI